MASFKFLNKLKEKNVLIFGGNSGFGFTVAEALIEHDANVVISGSNEAKLAAAAEQLKTSYPHIRRDQVKTIQCDLSQTQVLEEKLRDVFKFASENGTKPIDHVVTTAGDRFDVRGGISGTDYKLVQSILAVRVLAPILMGKVISTTDYVAKSAKSSFTMTSGTAHLRPRPTWPIVSMLSGGLQGLTTGLAVDLAPIRVNIVNPGAVMTDLFKNAPAEMVEGIKQTSLTKKLAKPEDIAEAYLYFMKDESVDGISINCDNGKLISG